MITNEKCPFNHKCAKKDVCYADTFCLKLFKMNSLWELALLTDAQRQHIQLRLDENGADRESYLYLKSIQSNIEKFIEAGDNLYIYSSTCGNGKTAWALRLLNTYLDKIWYKTDIECRALFIHVPRFLLALKDNLSEKSDYIQHIKQNILKADLVIWDEIGTKGLTSFEFENIINFVNARIDMRKSNIYTSNLQPPELLEAVGERLYSRIVNLSNKVEFVGADKRGLSV